MSLKTGWVHRTAFARTARAAKLLNRSAMSPWIWPDMQATGRAHGGIFQLLPERQWKD
jgi:hypothetical protein